MEKSGAINGYKLKGCKGGCILASRQRSQVRAMSGTAALGVELVWECQIPFKDDAVCFEEKHNGTVRNRCRMPVQKLPKLHWVKIG